MSYSNTSDVLRPRSEQDEMRYRITFLVTILVSSVLIIYGIINLIVGKIYPGIIETVFGLFVLIINLSILILKKKYIVPTILINVLTLLMSFYLYWSGGLQRTGIFWCLVFPGLFISTRGIRRGSIWIGAQISSLAILFFLSKQGVIEVAYGGKESIAALVAYGFSCFIHFSYEISRDRSKKEIRMLEGLLPICSYCKKIRDKDGKWEAVDSFLNNNRDIDFSHGICPDCVQTHFPKYAGHNKDKKQ